ncbi:MAG TPA: GNAT family N-acetyltransferase [Micromonosporaceae bacterium]|nr:GNAT family N-acetyltransferase [Micromonosporaceae bacterium]
MDITITDVAEHHRYEAITSDGLVGVLEYRREPGLIFFDHAETEPAYRGHGIAAEVVAKAMAAARDEGLKVVPRCSYVRSWIEQHPEFQPLVATAS